MLSLMCKGRFSLAESWGHRENSCLRVTGQVPASNCWWRQDPSVLLAVIIIVPVFCVVFEDHFNCPRVSIYGIIIISDGEKGVGGRREPAELGRRKPSNPSVILRSQHLSKQKRKPNELLKGHPSHSCERTN